MRALPNHLLFIYMYIYVYIYVYIYIYRMSCFLTSFSSHAHFQLIFKDQVSVPLTVFDQNLQWSGSTNHNEIWHTSPSLSWCVQYFAVIGKAHFKPEHQVLIEFRIRWKYRQWDGRQALFKWPTKSRKIWRHLASKYHNFLKEYRIELINCSNWKTW